MIRLTYKELKHWPKDQFLLTLSRLSFLLLLVVAVVGLLECCLKHGTKRFKAPVEKANNRLFQVIQIVIKRGGYTSRCFTTFINTRTIRKWAHGRYLFITMSWYVQRTAVAFLCVSTIHTKRGNGLRLFSDYTLSRIRKQHFFYLFVILISCVIIFE